MSILAAALHPAGASAAEPGPGSTRIWLGADSRPLPFDSDDEVLEFLAQAKVVDWEPIPIGITRPVKVHLSREGVEAHACFRSLHIVKQSQRLRNGRTVFFFRDSYRNEVAAWELSRMLGMDQVPPTVLRKIGRDEGSLQLWVEEAESLADWAQEHDRALLAEHPELVDRLMTMRIFDVLIHNIDRNPGNILVTADPDLVLIDHTRSFGQAKALEDTASILRCPRPLYDALEALDPQEVMERLRPIVGRSEARATLVRRDLLLRELRDRVVPRREPAPE